MHRFRQLAALLALVAFSLSSPRLSDGQSTDLPDGTPMGNIGAGSFVAVNMLVLLPANAGTLYFQNGALTTWFDLDKGLPSCRLYTSESSELRKLVPGRKLIVTGTRMGVGVANLYGDALIFDEDGTVGELQCRTGHRGVMTIGEMKAAFGNIFSLIQAPPVVG
jgi:hypothetical protein